MSAELDSVNVEKLSENTSSTTRRGCQAEQNDGVVTLAYDVNGLAQKKILKYLTVVSVDCHRDYNAAMAAAAAPDPITAFPKALCGAMFELCVWPCVCTPCVDGVVAEVCAPPVAPVVPVEFSTSVGPVNAGVPFSSRSEYSIDRSLRPFCQFSGSQYVKRPCSPWPFSKGSER